MIVVFPDHTHLLFLGRWGEGLHFQGAWEHWLLFQQSCGDLGSPAKKEKKINLKKSYLKGKVSILFDFLKKMFASGGMSPRIPLVKCICIYFRTKCKKESNDQESIQSSTSPDPGHHRESNK